MEERLNRKYPSVNKVTETEHIGMVKEIFSTITKRYDFLNHFLSMRRDIAWRRFTVKKMHFFLTYRFLDVACGTADLAVMAAKRYHRVKATGIDFVEAMLKAGHEKVRKKGLQRNVALVNADALCLSFKDNTFDVAAVAFGIRNIPDRMTALREMARVVVPDGQVMVLEMNHPDTSLGVSESECQTELLSRQALGYQIRGAMTYIRSRFFEKLYRLYLNHLLPGIAGLLSFNAGAYQYLSDSIMNFPSPDKFARLMEEAGLIQVKKHKLTFGITYLYTGVKPGMDKTIADCGLRI